MPSIKFTLLLSFKNELKASQCKSAAQKNDDIRSRCERTIRCKFGTTLWMEMITHTLQFFWISYHTVFLRFHIHRASASTLRQLCDDASNTVLIENNGVIQKWVSTPIWGNSIIFNENRITNLIEELSQR